jgi:rare lipoprotein A (peptidoglycan hydrolase)
MSVTELRTINNLDETSLNVGQKLKIPKKAVLTENGMIEAEPGAVGTVTSTKGTAETKVSTRPNSYLNSVDYVENGVAGWINDKSLNQNKSIALHRTAPIGTIVRVTNLMNNRSIYVKVIGTLPNTGDNDNTIIVLSSAAVKMLAASESKFRVSLNYSVPKD